MREAKITDLLSKMLDRLTAPQALRQNAEGQAQEIQHMVSIILRYAPQDALEAWWVEFEARLLENHQTRSWPTIGEVKAAASGGQVREVSPEEKELKILRAATEWFERNGSPHPSFNYDWVTRKLVGGGIISNHREAMVLGFAQYDEDRATAKEMRMSLREWKHHVEVMARLKGLSFEEAESLEISDAESPLAIPTKKLPERISARRAQMGEAA